MRLSLLLVCLIAPQSLAQVQTGMHRSPGEDRFYPISSGQLSFRPYYAVPGTWQAAPLQSLAQPATGHNVYRLGDPNTPSTLPEIGSQRRWTGYFRYPNYPGLGNTSPQDIRPPQYALPPIFATPYHNPYFEEKLWDDVLEGRDIDDYWGW